MHVGTQSVFNYVIVLMCLSLVRFKLLDLGGYGKDGESFLKAA